MPLKVGDRVRENTSSTGVGGLSLTGAQAGFQKFDDVLSDGDTTYYSLEENDKFEIGIGTYGSNNLERTTVLSSSNSGNKINLGGSGVVFITYPASKAIFSSETDQLVLGPSGLKFDNGNSLAGPKLVELIDVSLSGTPVHSSVFNLNIISKSLTIGDRVGNSNTANVLLGYGAGSGITTGGSNIIIGAEAATKTTTGFRNVHIGQLSGPSLDGSDVSAHQSVSIGYRAGDKMRHDAVAIGNLAAVNTYKEGFVAIGSSAGSGIGVYGIGIGYEALEGYGDGYSIGIGYDAGKSGGGQDGVWVGNSAGKSSSGATRSIGIGKNAGKSSSATDSIYIGNNAGESNSSNDHLFIANNSPDSNGTLIKGNMSTGRIAVGAADVTLSDTFYVGVSSSSENGIVVKGAVSQSADLTQWKNSSDVVLASVSNSGVVTGNAISASGNGLKLASTTPVSTSDTLYNVNSTLHWNGLAVGTPSGVPSGVAFFGNDSSIAQDQNIKYDSVNQRLQLGDGGIKFKDGTIQTTADSDTYVSGIATYSSGQAIANQSNITALLTASGTATSLISSSGIATYASGQAVSNQSTISTNTSKVTYASGQAISNQSEIIAVSGWSDSTFLKIDDDTYVSGIAVYGSGQAVSNQSSISTNTSNISANTSRVAYASGQAIANETDIVAVSGIAAYASGVGGGGGGDVTTAQLNYVSGIAVYASGHVHDDLYVSGIASYASGQAISNQSNITTNASNISTNIGNISSNTAKVNYASGQAIENESDIVAVSGIAAYASGEAGGTTYTAGSGLTLVGNEFNIHGGTGNFEKLEIKPTTTTNVGLTVQSAVSQSVNLQEWQNSSQTTLSHIDTSGVFNKIIGSSGTDVLRLQFGDKESNQTVTSNTDIKALWLDFEDGSEYTAGTVNGNALLIGTWYNTAKTISSRIKLTGTAFNVSLANSNKIDCQGTTTKFNTDVRPFSAMSRDLGSASIPWNNIYVSGVVASGVQLASHVPANTTNTLYNEGGTLKFNGSAIGGGGGDVSTAQLNYVSGIAVYSSGQAISNQGNITALLSASGTATSLIASSGIANYASGQAVSNQANITTNTNNITYVSGVATNKFTVTAADSSNYTIDGMGLNSATDPSIYLHKGHTYYFDKQTSSHPFRVSTSNGGAAYQDADGNSIEISGQGVLKFEVPQNAPDKLYYYCTSHAAMNGVIYTTNNVDEIIHVSGISTYASGQAVQNEIDIVYVSGVAAAGGGEVSTEQLNYVSGIAVYASGNSGGGVDVYTSGVASYASGQAIANETDIVYVSGVAAAGGSSLSAGSGVFVDGASKINVYGGSGNFQELQVTSDNVFVPKVVFTGSGAVDTPITLETRSSFESVSGSGSALLFQGTQGQLFSITDNLSSGVIFSVADIAGLPLIEADASGDVKLGEFGRYVGVGSGVPEYGLDISASGRVQKGVVLSSYVPAVTTNTLYNEGGTLKFNGSSIGGGGVDTYTSGVATYASGQAISNQSSITALLSASGTATSLIASSGIASYASGQAISNQGNITALLSASGTATSLIASSGIASYASGQAISNQSNIATNTSNISTNTSNISTNTARVNYASGQAIANENDIAALLTASGIATSLIVSSGIAAYASGQAIANESDILATSGIAHYASGQAGGSSLTAGSGITIDGADKINVYGGSGHFINLSVDGAFSATTKSFLIDHPTKDGMKLQYGSLEGPENGVYVRGTSSSNIITLPEYWSTLVDESTVTVTLTAIGFYQALYIAEKGKNYIKVGGAKGSYDYVVYGERKDVEKLKVEW